MSDQAPAKAISPALMPRNKNSDRYIVMAKRLVVGNYNSHHKSDKMPLKISDIRITWFAETVNGWKAMAASDIIQGLIWEVSFDSEKSEAHIGIWKRVNNVKIACKED
jgi:Family of unknown function (DUF6275)